MDVMVLSSEVIEGGELLIGVHVCVTGAIPRTQFSLTHIYSLSHRHWLFPRQQHRFFLRDLR